MPAKDGSLPERKKMEREAKEHGHALGRWSSAGTHWRARCQNCAWGKVEIFARPKTQIVGERLRWVPHAQHPGIVWIIQSSVSDRPCGPPLRT